MMWMQNFQVLWISGMELNQKHKKKRKNFQKLIYINDKIKQITYNDP